VPKFREEVVNVQLAEVLIERGLEAQPETVTRKKELPDVMINLGGLKLVIEGRIETNLKSLRRDAAERITDALADISIAVAYRAETMSAANLAALKEKVGSGSYSGSVFSFGGGALREDPFSKISIDELADLVNSAFRSAVQNDLVREQVKRVELTIEQIVESAAKSDLFFASDVLQSRLTTALGIDPNEKSEAEEGD
jgi:hypothetical protein